MLATPCVVFLALPTQLCNVFLQTCSVARSQLWLQISELNQNQHQPPVLVYSVCWYFFYGLVVFNHFKWSHVCDFRVLIHKKAPMCCNVLHKSQMLLLVCLFGFRWYDNNDGRWFQFQWCNSNIMSTRSVHVSPWPGVPSEHVLTDGKCVYFEAYCAPHLLLYFPTLIMMYLRTLIITLASLLWIFQSLLGADHSHLYSTYAGGKKQGEDRSCCASEL